MCKFSLVRVRRSEDHTYQYQYQYQYQYSTRTRTSTSYEYFIVFVEAVMRRSIYPTKYTPVGNKLSIHLKQQCLPVLHVVALTMEPGLCGHVIQAKLPGEVYVPCGHGSGSEVFHGQ